MLLICEKDVANYALLRCKTFSLKIWLCKTLDKYHVWENEGFGLNIFYLFGLIWIGEDLVHFCSLVSREVLTDPRDRKYYSDMYR